MICPTWYSFHGYEIWKYSKFCPPHFPNDIPISGQCYILYVLSSMILLLFSWIWNLKSCQVLSSTLFYWYTYLRTVINYLCSVLHDTSIFFVDLKLEIIPSFVLLTFLLIDLSQDSHKFSMFCPPRYFNFCHGYGISNYSKFCPPHFSIGIRSSEYLHFFMHKHKEIVRQQDWQTMPWPICQELAPTWQI